jgi:hypothetical protein
MISEVFGSIRLETKQEECFGSVLIPSVEKQFRQSGPETRITPTAPPLDAVIGAKIVVIF